MQRAEVVDNSVSETQDHNIEVDMQVDSVIPCEPVPILEPCYVIPQQQRSPVPIQVTDLTELFERLSNTITSTTGEQIKTLEDKLTNTMGEKLKTLENQNLELRALLTQNNSEMQEKIDRVTSEIEQVKLECMRSGEALEQKLTGVIRGNKEDLQKASAETHEIVEQKLVSVSKEIEEVNTLVLSLSVHNARNSFPRITI